MIYFPIGYQLPDNEDDLRIDIGNLFGILAAFMKEDTAESNCNHCREALPRIEKCRLLPRAFSELKYEIVARKRKTLNDSNEILCQLRYNKLDGIVINIFPVCMTYRGVR